MSSANESRRAEIRMVILQRREDAKETTALDGYMQDARARDLAYECCVQLAEEDSQRRKEIGTLIISYIVAFPPSPAVLHALSKMCMCYVADESCVSTLYADILEVVSGYLGHHPLVRSEAQSAPSPSKKPLMFRPSGAQQASTRALRYVSDLNMQYPASSAASNGGTNHIVVPVMCPRDGVAGVADIRLRKSQESASSSSSPPPLMYSTCIVKDYINQPPLYISQAVLEKYVMEMNSLHQQYRGNANVERATKLLVKVMCDGYVSKIPLGSSFSFFRSVSVCYMPILFDIMESEYLYTRNHVYDIILTLAVHFQLIDTQELYPGCTRALQEELIWMLMNVVHQQACGGLDDETTWLCAAKCVAAVAPRDRVSRFDIRALRKFMCHPAIGSRHPHIFTVFAESFAAKLLQCDVLEDHVGCELQMEEFALLGNRAVGDILQLYRLAQVPAARTALFRVVCAIAVSTLDDGTPSSKYAEAVQALIDIDFPWHFATLLFYQSHKTMRDLNKQVAQDLSISMEREVRTAATTLLERVMHLVEEESRLPEIIVRSYRAAREDRGGSRGETIEKLGEDSISVIPRILHDDLDGTLRNIGWRMLFNCFRIVAERLQSGHARDICHQLVRNITAFDGGNSAHTSSKVRAVCADVLVSLVLLNRVHHTQCLDSISALLDGYFANACATDIHTTMSLCVRLIELLTVRSSTNLSHRRVDVTRLCLTGNLLIPTEAIDALGGRVLWQLYWGLYSSQEEAVCRARLLVVYLLLSVDKGANTAQWHAWRAVLCDPHVPIAVVAAHRIAQMQRRNTRQHNRNRSVDDETLFSQSPAKHTCSLYMQALRNDVPPPEDTN